MNKKVVIVGGGHGLSNLVRGFKNENIDLSIVVASSDDGGHTGEIRKEFDSVAIGDLRRVLNEFIEEDNIMNSFFDYRFDSLHGKKNVSLGNLVITSLLKKYNDINKVINIFKEKLSISPNIYLASNNSVTLCAECENGEIITGESVIGEKNKNIIKLFMKEWPVCNEDIVLSPGSLYTSIGAVLCVESIKKAINTSKAKIFYVCNIMTQNGETLGYDVEKHVEVLESIMDKKIDKVIINNGKIDEDVLENYKLEKSDIVRCENRKDNYEFYNIVEIIDGKVRHNSNLVKKIILSQ